jgi:CzcA family heavy metal efflux pump
VNLVAALRTRASLVALATIAATAYGAVSLAQLPSGIYPDVDYPRIVVVAHVGDLPPEVVQTVATRPLEEAVATVPGMRRLRSRTIRGATELSAQFAPGTDMWRTLQLVEAHVADIRAELPADAELRIERVTPTALPIVTFNVSGADVDPRLLRETATRILRPALTRVPGIGTVEVQGGDVREYEVVLRPDALAAAHLTPSAIADRLAAGQLVAAVGRAHEEHQVLTVLVAAEPAVLADLEAMPIGAGANGPIALRDVASVVEGAEDRTTSVAGPGGDVVVITVSRAPAASAPDVVDAAVDVVDDLRTASALPAGVEVRTVYDQSALIGDAMHGVRDAILIGIALSMVVLAVFLRDWRAGVAAAVAVPITLVCTFGVMKLFGQTLNLMSLGGLAVAIGLVVDDAIVIVEGIVRRIEDGDEVAAAAERGTQDLFAAVVGTTATTVVVFAPLALISGVVGSFFGALAVTLSAAVILSLIVSVTVVPLVAVRVLRPRRARDGRVHHPGGELSGAYGDLVGRIVRHPVLSVIAIALLAAGGVLAAAHTATGFLPQMDEGALVVDFFLPPGTSLGETDATVRRLDHILETIPDVASFTRRTGAEMGPAAATQQNRGDILVRLVPRGQRRSVYAIMDDIRARAARDVHEARVECVQVLQDVLDDLSGNPRPIEVKIFGADQAQLEELARAAGKQIEDLPELDDFFNGVEGSVPVLRAEVDGAAAQRFGVKAKDVADDLEASLAGRVATHVRRGDQSIGVRVHMPDDVRFDPQQIASLPLAYGGATVPLGAVVTLDRPKGPSVLVRENLAPVVILTAAVKPGTDLAAATDAVARRLAGVHLPRGYRIEVGGQLASARETQRDLAGVFGLGIALVLAVLLVQLRSLRLALVVLLGAPLALVGAFVTLYVTGIALNASSLMGCVLLAGLVVKNGILLLEHAQAHADEPGGGGFAGAIARAGARRLRPILTAAAVVGLIPLALGFGAGSELQRPLAVATIGGLLLSTLVTLFAVPALAVVLMHRRRAPAPSPSPDPEVRS